MYHQKLWTGMKKFPIYLFPWVLFPSIAHASFIESTLGTAVVNDATAAYYNPAALVLLKNPQIIMLGSAAYFHTQFTGQATSSITGFTETGSASSHTNYYSPSLYLGIPMTEKITVGFATVSNAANRGPEENSILRYVQASNRIQDYDLVPAVGIKINEFFALGAGINFSYANFDLHPITGFPGSNIADSDSHNECDGTGIGANVGLLFRPAANTLVGFNYRSATIYRLSGTSIFNGNPQVVSNNYHFNLWTPARSVLSINHFVTNALGWIATVQRTQWSILQNIDVQGIATLSGSQPVILNARIPYFLHDTWLFTLGSYYHIKPKWKIRVAGSYNQSPGNSHYQITNGDSIILGASMGYDISKTITIDGSYAHAFMRDENINITGGRFLIHGVNEGARDAISLKLTFNLG